MQIYPNIQRDENHIMIFHDNIPATRRTIQRLIRWNLRYVYQSCFLPLLFPPFLEIYIYIYIRIVVGIRE